MIAIGRPSATAMPVIGPCASIAGKVPPRIGVRLSAHAGNTVASKQTIANRRTKTTAIPVRGAPFPFALIMLVRSRYERLRAFQER